MIFTYDGDSYYYYESEICDLGFFIGYGCDEEGIPLDCISLSYDGETLIISETIMCARVDDDQASTYYVEVHG